MKYRIEVGGRGGEIVIGRVSNLSFDYIKNNDISIDEYASDWDNDQDVPEDLQPFPPGEWHECDDLAHEFGSDVEDTFITVTDEENNVLLDNVSYDNLLRLGATSECDDIFPEDMLNPGDAYFIGQSYDKGLFYSFELEADAFDVNKLTIYTTDVDGWELVTGFKYNDEDLEDLGEMSTDGKGYDFSLHLVEED